MNSSEIKQEDEVWYAAASYNYSDLKSGTPIFFRKPIKCKVVSKDSFGYTHLLAHSGISLTVRSEGLYKTEEDAWIGLENDLEKVRTYLNKLYDFRKNYLEKKLILRK